MRALLPTDRSAPLLEFGVVAEPTPAPDEIVIAVEAFSINRGETFLLERPRPGWRPGKDIAGRVVCAAADGSGPAVGRPCRRAPRGGRVGELVAVSTSSLAVLPEPIDTTVAAALPLAGLTALRLLRASGPLAGSRVLVTGASGGVGHYVTELASAAGAAVTGPYGVTRARRAVAVARRPRRRLRHSGGTGPVRRGARVGGRRFAAGRAAPALCRTES